MPPKRQLKPKTEESAPAKASPSPAPPEKSPNSREEETKPGDVASSSTTRSTDEADAASTEAEAYRQHVTNDDSLPEEMRSNLLRLDFITVRAKAYSRILAQRMAENQQRTREERAAKTLAASLKSSTGKATRRAKGKKRGVDEDDESVTSRKRFKLEDEDEDAKPDKTDETEEYTTLEQPAGIRATLKEFQLQGVQWMTTLYENGLSGILADEMGLGKTLQTIAFISYLQSRNVKKILVVAPLSVVHNWGTEFDKFAPHIPYCIYHGTKDERNRLREEVLVDTPPPMKPVPSKKKGKAREPSEPAKFPVVLTTYEIIIRDRKALSAHQWGYIIVDEGHRLKNMSSVLMREIKQYTAANRMILTGTPLHNNLAELWSLLNFVLPEIFVDLDAFQQVGDLSIRFNLASFNNSSAPSSSNPSKQSVLSDFYIQHIITSLHDILKPFLLRRVKADVETNLPPKKEYILYAPLTRAQVEIYEAVLAGNVREWLIANLDGGNGYASSRAASSAPSEATDVAGSSNGGSSPPAAAAAAAATDDDNEDAASGSGSEEDEDGNRKMRLRRRAGTSYKVDEDDETYFNRLENGERRKGERARGRKEKEKTEVEIGKEFAKKQAIKAVNNMKLQNTIMQLRKVCSHPFLFAWPVDPESGSPVIGEELVHASGKMLLLDRLLEALIGKNAKQDSERPHKVLLFSQFVTMLDVIEDWAYEHKGWKTCRIDGSTSPQDRRQQMNEFNSGGNGENAPRLFLLSTRSGGLGINLVEADSVIFYDQDWNPQMDLQAQDRAHRIGQTRPVLIFRLVANHTIETKIMQKSGEKRKLEALVIAKGKFKGPHSENSKKMTLAEMAADLLRLESEKIHIVSKTDDPSRILSDEALNSLLDRSPEVFKERVIGWKKDAKEKTATSERTAFEVFETAGDEVSDGLSKIMGEDD